ncbi:MAG: hypothetical protein CM1200mP10_13630 [Candidatus Neomarinimicrobiota bacterium]|nr:MAG: hypothetical protein CM1200mP10_13630 [Candidatus Neomarinimicrobiota bacterium]
MGPGIDRYLGLINEGRINDVDLPYQIWESLYRNDPSFQYLKAFVTLNGKEALVIYRIC